MALTATKETAVERPVVVNVGRVRDQLASKLDRELKAEAREGGRGEDGAQMFTDI
jgi:hypothetical protein